MAGSSDFCGIENTLVSFLVTFSKSRGVKSALLASENRPVYWAHAYIYLVAASGPCS